jgi:FMN phosphatase YigB (HAD superfamily)
MAKTARVYDWMGVLLDMKEMQKYMLENYGELFKAYEEAKKTKAPNVNEIRERIVPLYNDAVDNARFPVFLFEDSKYRLEQDLKKGYVTVIFTGSPKDRLQSQLKDLGLTGLVNETVVLDEIRAQYPELMNFTKEDPKVFETLIKHLDVNIRIKDLDFYIDDTLARTESAAIANKNMQGQGYKGFGQIYHLDRKAGAASQSDGYRIVQSLMDL